MPAQVARVEQMESAAEAKAARGAKATIRREMTRVHTPAVATDNIGADAVRIDALLHLLGPCRKVH